MVTDGLRPSWRAAPSPVNSCSPRGHLSWSRPLFILLYLFRNMHQITVRSFNNCLNKGYISARLFCLKLWKMVRAFFTNLYLYLSTKCRQLQRRGPLTRGFAGGNIMAIFRRAMFGVEYLENPWREKFDFFLKTLQAPCFDV